MQTSLNLIELSGLPPSGISPEDAAQYSGDENAQEALVESFLRHHPNTLYLRIVGAAFGTVDTSDLALLVNHATKEDELRDSEIETVISSSGSRIRLDISEETRLSSIYAFTLTQIIIILLAIQAGLLQQDVDTLLVHPLERISMYLRPIMQDAISNISSKSSDSKEGPGNLLTGHGTSKAKGWRKMLG